MRKTIIGVMGPGDGASVADRENAYELGKLIATQGWVLLTGGRKEGVMNAANKGAKAADGLTLGILPTNDSHAVSGAVDLAVFTEMGNARNNINVLSSDVVIACGMGMGTASEVGLALKAGKKVVLLTNHQPTQQFFTGFSPDNVFVATSPETALTLVKETLTYNF